MTLLYHLKATAKPFSTTIFRESIGITPSPDEDWRWSIVEAKGIRPGQEPILPETLPGVPLLPLPTPAEPATSTPKNVPGADGAPNALNKTSQDKAAVRSDPPSQ